MGLIDRMTSASMLEALEQDFTLTARAYGLSRANDPVAADPEERALGTADGRRAVDAPTCSPARSSSRWSSTGPGIGQYATQAMLAVDYPVIMAITLLGAAGYLITNLVVDILQARLDPRTRS